MRWLHCNVDMDIDPFDGFGLSGMGSGLGEEKFTKESVDKLLETRFKVETTDAESSTESNKKSKTATPKNESADDDPLKADWMKDRFNRMLLTTFHDGNIYYHNGETVEGESEKEMRTSMLYGNYINMAICYMK